MNALSFAPPLCIHLTVFFISHSRPEPTTVGLIVAWHNARELNK